MDQALRNGRIDAINDIYQNDSVGRQSALASLGKEISLANSYGGRPTENGDFE
jgi:hypothetical protein